MESEEENEIVKYVNKTEWLRSFTLFELSYIVRNIIYPCIF